MRSFLSSIVTVCLFAVLLSGCDTTPQSESAAPVQIDPLSTIGSVCKIYSSGAIPVRGIGLVAGLAGTGSSECPQQIREELEKYIWKQIPHDDAPLNPAILIESQNTAIVEVFGVLHPLATTGEPFDVIVRPLSSTQTTSLDGGHLYTTELREASRLSNIQQFNQFSTIVARASGPIYSTGLSGNTPSSWYVLNGGEAVDENPVKLVLNQPDFLVANAIRNRINERFGPKVAVPDSESQITLNFPLRYQTRKVEFLDIVQFLLVADNPAIRDEYLQGLIKKLASEPNKEITEMALEGLGKPALDALSKLLDHPDPEVQFHAARCMLRIGDERPIRMLRGIIMDPESPYRIPAIIAVGRNAKRSTARPILLNVLDETDLQVRLATYEMLVELNGPEVSRNYVANKEFIVDSVITPGPKMIYAYQQGTPRIVIFGSPIFCENSVFIQSDDQTITLNAGADDDTISISRKHPSRPRVIGPVSSSRQLRSIIQTLGELPEENSRVGLAVPYAEILPLLKKMCLKNAIDAEFIAGPESELGAEFQNIAPNDR